MKSIDRFNIGLILIATIIYIILCINTKYKNIIYSDDNKTGINSLTPSDYRLLYFTTVYGFIYGTMVVSFHQRYLIRSVKSLWIWITILFVSILLIFSAFYSQIYTGDNVNSFLSKFSYALIPILPSMVLISESAISEVLEHGFNDGFHSRRMVIDNNSNTNETTDSW